jgi:hypothetical protein
VGRVEQHERAKVETPDSGRGRERKKRRNGDQRGDRSEREPARFVTLVTASSP